MKNKRVTRMSAALLAVALLLPCLGAPVTSAADKDAYEVMYSWDAAANSQDRNAEIMKNNSVPRTNYEYDPTRPLSNKSNYRFKCTIQTEEGERNLSLFAIRQTGDADGGLTMKSTGVQSKTMEPPIIEMTELGANPIIPNFYPVLTITHVLGVRPNTISEINMLRDDDALYTVHTNKGNSWTVGMQNWTLLGSGTIGTNDGIFYQITSEELVPDHVVLEKGERITGITYKPFGESTACFRGGYFMFGDLELRGYRSEEAFERDFPRSRTFTSVPEDTLRQIVVDAAMRVHEVEWTSNAPIRTENAAGASGVSNVVSSRTYPAHATLRGPIYQRSVLQSTEGWQAFLNEDNVWTGGYIPENATGMDCSTFVYNAISRVSQTNANTNMLYERDNCLYRLGDVKSVDDQPKYTDVDILAANDKNTMYEAYALTEAGDAMNVIKDDGSGIHSRLVREDAVVVRNPDGSIDPDKSYIPCIEQTSTATWHVRLADGTETSMTTNDWPSVLSMVESNPGAELLYGTCSPMNNYTFRQMLNSGYVVYSLVEYRDEQVKNANAQFTIVPNNAQDMTKGVNITAASYFRLVELEVTLEDSNQGVVLYEHIEHGARGRYEHQILDTAGLNKVLSQLPGGDYRLTVSAQTGPVTTLDGAMPVASRTMDFTLEQRNEDERQAELHFSAASASKGQEVTVTVELPKAVDTARVEVKFDSDVLSYVGGEILPETMFEELSVDGGMVRLACVDAGGAKQLATLTFRAEDTIGRMADVVGIKSVMSTGADAAVTADLVRGHYTTGTCPSMNMADVHENAWYHDAVNYVLEQGIMSGYGDTAFGPNDQLSRAMVVQVLYNKEGKPAFHAGHTFPDVRGDDWFNSAVAWAAANKIVDGYGDGRFGPNDKVTLEQIAVILWNYAGKPAGKGSAASLGAHSDWAAEAVSWAAGADLFDRVPCDALTDTATRAQTAQLLMNYLSR